jgi:urease beta subunit
MKVIKPVKLMDNQLVSSTAIETHPTWNSTTNYAKDDLVVYGRGIYQSLISTNTNNLPNQVGSSNWLYIGVNNTWAMFDDEVSTATVNTVPNVSNIYAVEVKFESPNNQAVALLNVVGSKVVVTVEEYNIATEQYDQVYTSTQYLLGQVLDWYQYFFYIDDTPRTQAVFIDLPTNAPNTITTVRVEGNSPVSIGVCTFGTVLTLGKTELGTSTGITDYSVKQTDEFGKTTFVTRAYSKRMSANILINNAELNRTQRALYDLRAVPSLWIASNNPNFEESLVVFGYYKDFSTTIPYPSYSYCSLEIEGLI